jgi:hypothetical protein
LEPIKISRWFYVKCALNVLREVCKDETLAKNRCLRMSNTGTNNTIF